MWAMIVKEFRQLRRDRRTLAMMIVLPVLLLVVFGYAASFDVTSIPVTVTGSGAAQVAARLPAPFQVHDVRPAGDRSDAVRSLRDGEVPAAVVADASGVTVLLDGSELFTANAARAALARLPAAAPARVEVLFNPSLKTSAVMVPGLAGMILLFVGTVITSLGISSVSQNQGQAIQLAVMTLLPQILLSGLIFPLRSMPVGVRWLGYLLPLTYFTQIARGVMLRGAPLTVLWRPFTYLALLGVVVVVFATLRFRRFLAPAARRGRR